MTSRHLRRGVVWTYVYSKRGGDWILRSYPIRADYAVANSDTANSE
jgi:hypothetical protein